eukprot:2551755-Pyramimonas_sp.AAC.1
MGGRIMINMAWILPTHDARRWGIALVGWVALLPAPGTSKFAMDRRLQRAFGDDAFQNTPVMPKENRA